MVIFNLVNSSNKAIKRTETDYRNVFLENPNPMWIYQPESLKFLYVNNSAITNYGYSREEFLQMTIKDIRLPEDHEAVIDSAKKVMYGQYSSGTWRHFKKDGTAIYVNITAQKFNIDGEDCVMVLACDNTSQVKYEQELEQINQVLQEEKLKLKETEKLAKVSGWEYYVEAGSLIWSDELYEIFDIDREAENLDYGLVLKSVHREDLSAYNQAIENILKLGKDLDITYRFITKTGSIRYVKLFGKMQYRNGKMFKVQGSMQDVTELKLMQQEKNVYLQRLNYTLENINDGYYLMDSNWTIIDINFNCEKLLNLRKEDIINRRYLDVFPASVNSKFYQSYKKVFKDRILVNFEEYDVVLRKWFCVNAYPTDGGVAVYFNDISESKQKDLQLKEVLERYDLVAKATKDVIYDHDIITDQVKYSNSITELLNLPLNKIEYNYNWWKDRVHPDDFVKVFSRYTHAIETKQENFRLEYRVETGDNQYKYVYDQGYLQYDANNNFVRTIGAIKDIDQLKRFDDENKRLADIITKVNNMIVIQDAEGKTTWVNKAFETFTDFTLAEIIGKRPSDLLNGSDSDPEIVNYIVSNQKAYKSFACEVINYTKSKQKYWGKVEFTPLFTADGKPDGYISIQNNITEQKEKEEKISRQNEILKNIAWLSSHELRKPVASILGLIELINDTDDLAEKEESIQLMQQCTRHLDEIIRKINSRVEEEITEN